MPILNLRGANDVSSKEYERNKSHAWPTNSNPAKYSFSVFRTRRHHIGYRHLRQKWSLSRFVSRRTPIPIYEPGNRTVGCGSLLQPSRDGPPSVALHPQPPSQDSLNSKHGITSGANTPRRGECHETIACPDGAVHTGTDCST